MAGRARAQAIGAALATAALTATLGAVPATAAPAPPTAPTAAKSPPGSGIAVHVEPVAAKAALAWTPQRMRAAVPAVLDPEGHYLAPAQAEAAARAASKASRRNRAPKSTGRLFFSYDGADYSCSAATVFDPTLRHKASYIATAGHCLHHGAGGDWHSDFAYVPKYRDGKAPLGVWTAKWVLAYRAWTVASDVSRDQGMIRLRKVQGQPVTEATAANIVEYSAKRRQRRVRVVGWPAQPPYSGEQVRFCTGPTTRRGHTSDARIECAMNGGASGGPWFSSMLGRNRGTIMAVTSRRTTGGTPRLLATPFPRSYREMFKTKPA